MIQMSELVKDPTYKRFLQTKPKLPPIANNKHLQNRPPWVVYVQVKVDGPWGKKEFWKYTKAFDFLKRCLKANVHDATINNRRVPTDPPMRLVRIKGRYVVGSDGVRRQATTPMPWKPRLSGDDVGHQWCPYCRRPTVFKFYSKHKALKEYCDPSVRRCCICGASERITRPGRARP